MRILIRDRTPGRHGIVTEFKIPNDEKTSLTCGTFLTKYASTILKGLNLTTQLSIWEKNTASFNMVLSGLAKYPFVFDTKTKDRILDDVMECSIAVFDLEENSGEGGVFFDLKSNTTPLATVVRSNFPQQAQNPPHLELLHRLNNVLDNYAA